MLRGTRTQYLRRRQYLSTWIWVPFSFFFYSIPVVLSTGWQRIALAAVLLPTWILALLVVISRLSDTQWYRKQADLQRKMNQRGADATYMPGLHRKKAIAFAKRLFGKPRSD